MNNIAMGRISAFGLFVLLNLVLVPTESYDGGAATGLSQLIRIVALSFIVGLYWLVYFPRYIVVRPIPAFVLLTFTFGLLVANFGSVRVNLPLVLYPVLMSFLSYCIFVLAQNSPSFRHSLALSLKWIVIFWVGAYFVQFLLFVANGELLDVHNFFFPYSAQRSEVVADGLIRLGGVHIEPGTYSNWLFGVLVLRSLLTKKLFDRVNALGFFALPASLSVWGIISSGFVLLAYLIKNRSSFARGALVIFATVSLLGILEVTFGFVTDIHSYLESRSSSESSSTSTKFDAYNAFSDEVGNFLFVGKDVAYEFCNNCWSIQDAGVLVNLSSKIGVVLTVFVFFLSAYGVYIRLGAASLVLVMPMLWAKWFYWDPIFWLLIFFAFSHTVLNPNKVRACE